MAVEFGKWQKIEREDSKKNPPAGIFFMKGWWTNHRDEPIKRAIYGQKLRFHIQMNKNFAQVGGYCLLLKSNNKKCREALNFKI